MGVLDKFLDAIKLNDDYDDDGFLAVSYTHLTLPTTERV